MTLQRLDDVLGYVAIVAVIAGLMLGAWAIYESLGG
jgi:hypothetical protein